MNQYRDFEHDLNTFPYEEGEKFLSKLHEGGRHYVPIIDSAIYVPNPNNASDRLVWSCRNVQIFASADCNLAMILLIGEMQLHRF